MSHYKVSLHLTEQEITTLCDALSFYAENANDEIKEDVQSLCNKVEELYIEENTHYQMSSAAKAFIDQFGIEEMFNNIEKWEKFKKSYNVNQEE
jgi:hypothetical protein